VAFFCFPRITGYDLSSKPLWRGLPLAISVEIGSLEVIKQVVQQGLGIVILAQLAVRHTPTGTIVRGVEYLNLHLPFGFITREVPLPQSKVVQAFMAF
jgi:LysR family transcriptional regulator, regulator of the ytmI operon